MKRFCVIGLGNFGFHVAKTLFEDGHDVLAIDADHERVQRVKDFCDTALEADAANKEFLSSQGVHEVDAVVVSTGERSHLSTLITLYLKELKAKRIIVKALSEEHGRILEKVGASEVIYPEKDMAVRTARSLSIPNVLDFLALSEDVSISEAAPPKDFVGKNLVQLDLRRRSQVTVIAIKDLLTDQFIPAPPPDYVIKDSDLLVLIGRSVDIEKLLEKSSK